LLIRGVTQELYWGNSWSNHPQSVFQRRQNRFGEPAQAAALSVGLVDLFTPLSVGRININTASSAVLQLIPGVDALVADAIVSARGGEDDGTDQTGPFRSLDPRYLWARIPGLNLEVARQLQRVCDVHSRTFEIHIDAEISGYKREFVAVV